MRPGTAAPLVTWKAAMRDIFTRRDQRIIHFHPALTCLFNLVAILVAGFHIVNALAPLVSESERNMIHFAGFAFLAFLYYPLLPRNKARSLPLDLAFALILLATVLYFYLGEDAIYRRQSDEQPLFTPIGWLAGALLIILAIEGTRRTTGRVIPVLIVIALSYVSWLGPRLPGVFRFGGLSGETVLFRSIYGDDALFGKIASISSTYVFLFILFGAFLTRAGAGTFVIDLARGVARRFIGGPGFVAVIASALTGTISGSAVANTASTGVITIPLMKRTGFPAIFAAAVETAASTGGQIMPPIMGAGAFVMSSYTLIPYEHIVTVAFLPAILYFLSVAMFVRIEAKKQGASRSDDESPKPFLVSLKEEGASFLIPITVVITLLVKGYTPTYAAMIGIGAIIVSSWLTKHKMGPKTIILALIDGTKSMIMIAVLLSAIGLLINVISTTGAGTAFSLMIDHWAGGNLLAALFLVALASLILGMGLPVTAAYIVLATLSAPALTAMMLDEQLIHLIANHPLPESVKPLLALADPALPAKLQNPLSVAQAQALLQQLPQQLLTLLREQLIDPAITERAVLSAHMIVFYLAQVSNVTPPVCLAAFTAATIAKTPPMATGFQSWKLAKGIYIAPLLFAYTPFLSGNLGEALVIFFFATFATYALAAAFQGAMERPINARYRLLTAATGIALLWPRFDVRVIALLVFIVLFLLQYKYFPPPSITAGTRHDIPSPPGNA